MEDKESAESAQVKREEDGEDLGREPELELHDVEMQARQAARSGDNLLAAKICTDGICMKVIRVSRAIGYRAVQEIGYRIEEYTRHRVLLYMCFLFMYCLAESKVLPQAPLALNSKKETQKMFPFRFSKMNYRQSISGCEKPCLPRKKK